MANLRKMKRGKLARAYGFKIDAFCGSRDLAEKCRKSAPGMHQDKRQRQPSDFKVQWQMKQLIRFTYGVMEKQMRRYYLAASSTKGSTADNLLTMLECRLDNVVYRIGFAATRREARQLVSHGHITVNGQRVTIASYKVKPGDEISVTEKSRNMQRILGAVDLAKERELSPWLEVDFSKLIGRFTQCPEHDQFDPIFNANLVIEFYSK